MRVNGPGGLVKVQTTCRICRSEGENTVYAIPEMQFGTREKFDYFQCESCKCLQIANIPKDLSQYYPSDYESLRSLAGEPPHMTKLKTRLDRRRVRYALTGRGLLGRVLYLRKPDPALKSLSLVNMSENTRVLDVGCGTGHLLYCLRTAGFCHVMGVDPFINSDIEYSNGLRIKKCALGTLSGCWDIIMFHHSFEHVPDARSTLLHVKERLSSGGACLLRIPTCESWAWKHYREYWAQADAPRHVYLHSKKSISVLANETGMTVEGFVYDSTEFQFLASELYSRGISWKEARTRPDVSHLFKRANVEQLRRRAARLNALRQGDQFVCILRKAA